MHPTVTNLHAFRLSFFCFLVLLLGTIGLQAQQRGGKGGDRSSAFNIGRFYGKVVDEDGKGIGFATVQLFGKKFDRETKSMKEGLISGQITEDNGEFSLEELPIRGDFTLKISVLGFATMEQTVSFGVPGGRPGGSRGQRGGGRPSRGGGWGGGGGASKFDKDLGDIVLSTEAETLDEVVVTGEAANVTLALDRKVFRVDKDASAVGGTAEDALRNVPSLSIDIDGNLTLRNASPQLFVDGRPTTLSLDQISADEIETVEVITNPSAKYDASGGQAGIVNIVLKKDRRVGYNGNVRAGFDTQGGLNGSASINMRENKVNTFLSGNYFGRRRLSESEANGQNFFGNPNSFVQTGDNESDGFFASGRAGVDWFINNRNTITFEGSYRRGEFGSDNVLTNNTVFTQDESTLDFTRNTVSDRMFEGLSGAVLFKHNFAKEGKEWTADVNFSQFSFDNETNFRTDTVGVTLPELQRQTGFGKSTFITFQTDYVEPLGENMKLELGARAAYRIYENSNRNLFFNHDDQEFFRIVNFADDYEFTDDVLAAYATFSQTIGKWGYQAGLRAESSRYTGTLLEGNQTFENDFPFNLFPSVFVTYSINESDNIQVSYTRKINRPSFFNLIPFTDYSNVNLLRRGNPDLRPEFTNSFELTYQNIFDKGDNVLVSAYYKEANDLFTTYQFSEFDDLLNDEVLVLTYANANGSYAYGLELTSRNTLFKNVELTSNLNMYNSRVDAANVEEELVNDQFTWFLKENLVIRWPNIVTIQLNGQYQSRAAFSAGNGGGRGGWRRRTTNTAQGYTRDYWFVDVSLRKDLFKRKGTLTVSISDIFGTRRNGSVTDTEFFFQDTWRLNNPRVVRVNFSYRFGKMDFSLFKRKNTNRSDDGSGGLMN